MVVAIAGGALQGLEVTYLARKAGFETLLLDRRPQVPATGLCHRFTQVDLRDQDALGEALESVDLVFPATENGHALTSLGAWCAENGIPLAHDPDAYAVSSSKSASDALFQKLGLPAPAAWPECGFPVLAKPDGGSGSRGVEVFSDLQELDLRFGSGPPPGWVLQKYLPGPSYSVEVLGRPGAYLPVQITALEMDREFDCKRVLAPGPLPPTQGAQFREMAVILAESVGLKGIMDVEIVVHDGQPKVLEIDARFPSQTPMAVFHSSGFNMVEGLARVARSEVGADTDPVQVDHLRGVVLEHIRVGPGELVVCGERVMASAGPLTLETDFFGADEALTNHDPETGEWVATLIVSGSDLGDALARRDQVIGEIRDRYGLSTYRDESPNPRVGLAS